MNYIAYYRVSTNEQSLGLKAQETTVRRYIKNDDTITATFIEKETGTRKRFRPILNKAIEECKRTNSTLLIAKLDRLARNVAFVSTLMDSGVEFKALDMPHANRLTIHIFAAIAEHEAEIISQRTKAGLAEKKKELALIGKKLGTPSNLTDEARRRSIAVKKENARNNLNNQRAKAYALNLRRDGMKLKQIADSLNDNSFRTARGKEFHPIQVSRLLG